MKQIHMFLDKETILSDCYLRLNNPLQIFIEYLATC